MLWGWRRRRGLRPGHATRNPGSAARFSLGAPRSANTRQCAGGDGGQQAVTGEVACQSQALLATGNGRPIPPSFRIPNLDPELAASFGRASSKGRNLLI